MKNIIILAVALALSVLPTSGSAQTKKDFKTKYVLESISSDNYRAQVINLAAHVAYACRVHAVKDSAGVVTANAEVILTSAGISAPIVTVTGTTAHFSATTTHGNTMDVIAEGGVPCRVIGTGANSGLTAPFFATFDVSPNRYDGDLDMSDVTNGLFADAFFFLLAPAYSAGPAPF